MIVRQFEPGDMDEVRRIHGLCGFDYVLPDFSGKEFFSGRVVQDRNGIGMAAFLRLSAEAFLIADPQWKTPAWRMEALRQIQAICTGDARNAGVAEVEAWIPPEIESKFGKRLVKMGWQRARDGWKSYSFPVNK